MTKPKSPTSAAYSTSDRRDAARVLRAARDILMDEGDPFPILKAARRAGVRTDSLAWGLVAHAREAVGGQRDAHQLEAAANLVESNNGSPSRSCSPKLARVPRCRLHTAGGRCVRPVGHKHSCTQDPSPNDLVRSVGTDHVLVGGSPTVTTMIVAWETAKAGKSLRVCRDDHERGLWIDHSSSQQRRSSAPLLLGWLEIRRLVLDLSLELADRRVTTGTGQPSAGSRPTQRREKKKHAP